MDDKKRRMTNRRMIDWLIIWSRIDRRAVALSLVFCWSFVFINPSDVTIGSLILRLRRDEGAATTDSRRQKGGRGLG